MTTRRLAQVALGAIVLAGFYRLWPVVAGQTPMSRFFLTEDGYLMLTVARNMATGLGMSVSEGMIPTNGVQPLSTFLFAVPYALTGGDKVISLIGVHLVMASAALGGALAVRALAARMLAGLHDDPVWPLAAAALWFTGPLLVFHTMNGLETGLYTLCLLLALLQFGRVLERGRAAGRTDMLLLGAALGLAFLARIDAVFLGVAVYTLWVVHLLAVQRLSLQEALGRVVPAGGVTVALSAPWLIANYLRFGDIMPVSGTAQSLQARPGQNLDNLPAILFEHGFPMLPLPAGIQSAPLVAPVAGIVTGAALAWFLWRRLQAGGTIRWVVLAYLAHGVALGTYYGVFFGAVHFLGRYLAPIAPFLIVAVLVAGLDLLRLLGTRGARVAPLLAAAGLALCIGLLGWHAVPGTREQGHFQVVEWVERNVDDETWVAAVQTGTLGYWHDRTINLDGKVNPEALAEREARGTVLPYVVRNERIRYIADWHGMATWADDSAGGFDEAFELVVSDPAANLAILRRRGGAG
ncbi:MAG: hypothetical protein V2I65_09150 [Paracoccaceae bacterium]|jgi:hypothetical protein|nr:hypothetical protein [Paracoccaceae bacterium]